MKYVLMSGSFSKMEIYQEIINFLVKNLGDERTISFIPCDFDDYEGNDHFKKKIIKLFEDKEFFFSNISMIDSRLKMDEMYKKIENSSLVFLLGGDVLMQIQNIEKYSLKSFISKKITIGMSAGAINMAKKVVLAEDKDDNIPSLSIYEGIGITDINIEPHCDFYNEDHWKDIEEASSVSDIVVMNDDAYIICDEKIDYYGKYVILRNKKIYYNNQLITLQSFIEEVLNA